MVGIEGKNPPGISDPSKKLVQNLYNEKKARGTAVSGGKDIYFIANLYPQGHQLRAQPRGQGCKTIRSDTPCTCVLCICMGIQSGTKTLNYA
jgi:hypothetical protein